MSYQGPAGAQIQVVQYVGDGTLARIIALKFTPRRVKIVTLTDGATTDENWDGDLTVGFVSLRSGAGSQIVSLAARPQFFPLVQNGFDVGKAHNFNGIANVLNQNIMIIAQG